MTKILDDYHVVYLPINSKNRNLTLWSKKLIKITNILHHWPPADTIAITIMVKLLPASIMVWGVKRKILHEEYFKNKIQRWLDEDKSEFELLF